MDGVILAAGKGQRLNGHVMPFFKPLVEVNGKPLVLHAVEYAITAGARRIAIVAAPGNASAIEAAVRRVPGVSIVIQPFPEGPGDALRVGLEQVGSTRAIVLMSDNVMDSDAVAAMATHAGTGSDAIGYREVPLEDAHRFTRIRRLPTTKDGASMLGYVEGTPITQDDEWYPGSGTAVVWCGPIILHCSRALTVLNRAPRDETTGELKIGPHLGSILRQPTLLSRVVSFDIGVPDSLKEFS